MPVFTAHPSEARRRTILEKLAAIARVLDRLSAGPLPPAESEEYQASIAEEVETFWLTDTVRGHRPTVLDEVRQGLGLVEERLLAVVPRVYRRLEAAFKRVYPWQRMARPAVSPVRHLDRRRPRRPPQRHPRRHGSALRLQQETILTHYLERVDDLWRRLSHSDHFMPARRGESAGRSNARRPRLPGLASLRPSTSPTGRSAG